MAVMLLFLLKLNDPVTFVLQIVWYLAEGALAIVGLHMLLRFVAEARNAVGEEAERRSLMLVAIVGSVAAVAAIWRICEGPFLLPGWAGVRTASIYIVATVAAGAVAMLVGWTAQKLTPVSGWMQLCLIAAVGWALLPCVMMLARGRSPLALAMALVATVPAVLGLRRVIDLRGHMEPMTDLPVAYGGEVLPYLFGTPRIQSGYRSAVWVAICTQAAIALAVADWMVAASVLAMAGSAVAVWRWGASLRMRDQPSGRVLQLRAGGAAALALLIALMTQRLAPSLAVPQIANAAQGAERGSHYFSVILTQPKKKKEMLSTPLTLRPALSASLRKPMVIPFDGPYWYFQPPLARPDAGAHRAQGRAAEVNVRSTNELMLMMEAEQILAKPIETNCCRELDVAVTNADTRPGRIVLAVLLRSVPSQGQGAVMLPEQVLVSSLGKVEHRSAPVEEVLRFPIPKDAAKRLPQFNEITVLFVPQRGRLYTGTKVEVESFTLQP